MKWTIQEKPYSCGANAIRNCLLMFGEEISERKVRDLAGTTTKGTTEKGIFKCLDALGYGYQVHLYINKDSFERNITRVLDQDRPVIALVDNCDHWVSVVSRFHRKLVVIDSEFKRREQEFLMSDFSRYAFNYDKYNKKQYYYFIEVFNLD